MIKKISLSFLAGIGLIVVSSAIIMMSNHTADAAFLSSGIGDPFIVNNLTVQSNATVTGTVTAASFVYSSDRNLKTNIKPIENALDKVGQLQGVSFNWKQGNGAEIGFIAQDVEKVLPELVVTNPDTGLKAVKYGNIVPVLVEAIKAQQQEIEELKALVNAK